MLLQGVQQVPRGEDYRLLLGLHGLSRQAVEGTRQLCQPERCSLELAIRR
jgi:hypothetical protein